MEQHLNQRKDRGHAHASLAELLDSSDKDVFAKALGKAPVYSSKQKIKLSVHQNSLSLPLHLHCCFILFNYSIKYHFNKLTAQLLQIISVTVSALSLLHCYKTFIPVVDR